MTDILLFRPSTKSTFKTEPLLLKANKSYGSSATVVVEAKMNRIWDEVKNEKLGIDTEKRKILSESRITVSSSNLKDEKANAKTAEGMPLPAVYLFI